MSDTATTDTTDEATTAATDATSVSVDAATEQQATEAAAKKVEMSQEDLQAIIDKATARGAKAARKELETEAQKASMSEMERLQAEKAEVEQRAAELQAKSDAKLIRADAKLAAQTAKVKSDRIDAFLKLVDLSGVEVDDDGNVDTKALKKLIDAGVKDYPEFIDNGTQPPPRGGGQHNGDEPAGRATSLDDAVNKRLAAAS